MTHGIRIPITREQLLAALAETGGAVRRSAALLNLNSSTFMDMLRREGLVEHAARLRWEKEGRRLQNG